MVSECLGGSGNWGDRNDPDISLSIRLSANVERARWGAAKGVSPRDAAGFKHVPQAMSG